MKSDYQTRSILGFNRPIEFNHAGNKIYLAHINESYVFMPMGPNCNQRFVASVVKIDEEQEMISLCDGNQCLNISFEDWAYMKPYKVETWKLDLMNLIIKTKQDFEKYLELCKVQSSYWMDLQKQMDSCPV